MEARIKELEETISRINSQMIEEELSDFLPNNTRVFNMGLGDITVETDSMVYHDALEAFIETIDDYPKKR